MQEGFTPMPHRWQAADGGAQGSQQEATVNALLQERGQDRAGDADAGRRQRPGGQHHLRVQLV